MIGRRLPVPESGEINDIYNDLQPGDYVGPMPVPTDPGNSYVFMKLPNGSFCTITEPPWVFRECPDGSLEIRESIYHNPHSGPHNPNKPEWHGFLDEGHNWREV